MNLKENIKSFFTDEIRIITFLATSILCGYHIYQFITIQNPICILRIIMYGILSISVFMIGLKITYLILIILAYISCYFNSFVNFTGFFVLLLACRMNRRSEKWLLALYVMNESVALIYQHKEISHLLIHIITCVFFYMIYFFVNKPKILELEEDEEEIIKEMACGKLQKEITLYSKNVIKEKLDHAKIRNHILSTDELITLYRQSHI